MLGDLLPLEVGWLFGFILVLVAVLFLHVFFFLGAVVLFVFAFLIVFFVVFFIILVRDNFLAVAIEAIQDLEFGNRLANALLDFTGSFDVLLYALVR